MAKHTGFSRRGVLGSMALLLVPKGSTVPSERKSALRIKDVRGYRLRAQLKEPFAWPDGQAYSRTASLVRIETEEGLVGWGPGGWSESTAAAVRGVLIGQSAFDTWKLSRQLPGGGLCGALDIAMWDLKGKLLGHPVHQLLGGALRDRVPAYATGGYYLLPQDNLDWLRGKVREAVNRGFRYYKMKIGRESLTYDLKRIDAVQELLGPDRLLAVDATTGYNRTTALEMGKELEKRRILWYEDPLPADDIEGYVDLCKRLDIPITAHYGGGSNLMAVLRSKAAAQVQPSIEGVGGYTQALQVIGMTSLQNIIYKPSCWSTHLHMAATLHLLAILPSQRPRWTKDAPTLLEFDTSENPLRDDSILKEPIRLESDGTVQVPNGPGLGVEVLEDKLAKYLAS